MSRYVFLIFALIALCHPAAAQAGADETGAPADFVKTVTLDVVSLLNRGQSAGGDQDSQLRQLLEDSVDLKGVGQFVLDRHWQGATDAQRAEYLGLFSDYVMTKLIRALREDPVRDISVVESAAPQGGDATVRTQVLRGTADSLDWTWKLRKTGQSYRAIDLISDGISLARTLQSEFGSYVDTNGIEALLQVLRTKRS